MPHRRYSRGLTANSVGRIGDLGWAGSCRVSCGDLLEVSKCLTNVALEP